MGSQSLTDQGEQNKSDSEIFQRDVCWIREADIIVAEVTMPSLGVGYELGFGESLGKPVICLYREKEGRRLSAMIAGNPRFQAQVYQNVDEAIELVKDFIHIESYENLNFCSPCAPAPAPAPAPALPAY